MAFWQSVLHRMGRDRRATIDDGAASGLFPERQVMIREGGRLRHFTLRRHHQLAAVLAAAGCLSWAALATGGWVVEATATAGKEQELNRRMVELDSLRQDYRAAIARLDDFRSLFASITCEINGIQGSLLKIAEHSAPAGKATDRGTPPRLEVNLAACGAAIAGGPEISADRIGGAMPPPPPPPAGSEQEALKTRLSDLQEQLDQLRSSHDTFLQQSASLTALRIAVLEKTLSSVGVDPRQLRRPDGQKERYGQGGPFIPAPPRGMTGEGGATVSLFNAVSLFNTHAEHLDSLNSAVRGLPLGAPLLDYEVTSPFGARNDPINTMTGFHEGIDLGAALGTPVLATGDGKITTAGWHDRYGNMVEIQHSMGLRSRYAHLGRMLVQTGDTVRRGTPIGLLGETGRTTGPHLHYEVRVGDEATNPQKFMTAGQDVLKIQ